MNRQRIEQIEQMVDEAVEVQVSKIDLIYDAIDSMMKNGQFQELDSSLVAIDVASQPVDRLIGMLTATLPAHSHLPSRAAFYDRVERELKERGEYEPGLLDGLKR